MTENARHDPWEPADVQRLVALRGQKPRIKTATIALALGRTPGAVRKKVSKLKIGRPYRKTEMGTKL